MVFSYLYKSFTGAFIMKLTVIEYLFQRWSRIYSFGQLLKPTYHPLSPVYEIIWNPVTLDFDTLNWITNSTWGSKTDYPFRANKCNFSLLGDSCCSVFDLMNCFSRLDFRAWYFKQSLDPYCQKVGSLFYSLFSFDPLHMLLQL